MSEIVNIKDGKWGNKIGDKLWEIIYDENGIEKNGE